MTTITVSNLPNINFYTGEDATFCADSVENRKYGEYSDYFGYLGLNASNNSYWTGVPNSIFSENPVNYNNIGDILSATISYMDKFKNNKVDIRIDKNILTFNYNLEENLNNDFDNTSIIPASELINLLLNVNDMTFNKRHYYGDNIELKEVSYMRKKYPYNPENTIYNIPDPSEESGYKTYDFSRQFVDYRYTVLEGVNEYERHYLEPYEMENGEIGYYDTGLTYIEEVTYYTYELDNINELNNRINAFFNNNSERVENEYQDLKTYYISELDTVLPLTLNTFSLSSKNIYAYFNFSNNYDNWYSKSIAFTMNTKLENDAELLSIEPIEESWFNVIVNDNDMPCGVDQKLNSSYTFTISNDDLLEETPTFKIINPTKIKKLDLSSNTDKITSINLINNFNKRIDVHNVTSTNWLKETSSNIELLILGNDSQESSIQNIFGINELTTLKSIDITNCKNLKHNFSITNLDKLVEFKAGGSNIKNFIPHHGNEFTTIKLPETLKTLILKNISVNDFEYNPTGNLINLTLENVTGIDTKTFVTNWIHQLEITETDDNTVLYDGIIQNTNLVGFNWQDFDVNVLKKFKYLGLNRFEGTIGIKGEGEDNTLTRKNYLDLRDIFGDEIMHTGKYSQYTHPNITFNYTLDPNAYKKELYVYYYFTADEKDESNYSTFILTALDNIGGNSLLDFIDDIDHKEVKMEYSSEFKGYVFELSNNSISDIKKIYTDSDASNTMTKSYGAGDIVLYKGTKLIFANGNYNQNNVKNFIKLGTLLTSSNEMLEAYPYLEFVTTL